MDIGKTYALHSSSCLHRLLASEHSYVASVSTDTQHDAAWRLEVSDVDAGADVSDGIVSSLQAMAGD